MVETRVLEPGNAVADVEHAGKANDCSIRELISFLKTAFRPTDFEEVERMLMLREEKLKLDKEALEDKMKYAVKREVELEEELKAYRTRCWELEETNRNAQQSKMALSIELDCVKKEWISLGDKPDGLEFDKFATDDELKKYKRLWGELKEKFTRLQEDYKVVCEREKRAQERISTLSGELKKMEDETREKYAQLKVENWDLVCGKKRAEDEIETWKKRFVESESGVIGFEEDTSDLIGRNPQLFVKLEAEPGDTLNTISHEDKEKKEALTATKIQEEASDGGDGACLVHPQVKNRRLNCDAGTNLPANVGSSCPSPAKESRNVQVTGPPCIRMPREHLVSVKEGKDNVSLETELQDVTRVRRQLEFGQEGSTDKKMAGSKPGSGRPMSRGVIEIIDSDDETSEMNIVAVATSSIRDKGKAPAPIDNSLKGVLKDEKEMTSGNCLERINSSQRREENRSSCKGSYELSSNPKRKQASDISSDSEDEIPIGKIKMKKLQDVIHESMGYPVNWCSTAPIVSSGDCNVEESFIPSKWRLVTPRQCERRKSGLERNSPGHLGRNESDSEYQIMAGPAAENAQDHEGEDGSDTEGGETLDGFIIDGSDDDDDLVISMIRRNRKNKLEWTFEADMLSSFQKDPELCMKAVCVLYRQQAANEKSINGSLYLNNRGFSKFDAVRGTNLAKFLIDGSSQGELKKTLEELEKHIPGGLDECRRLASHYSKQLFKIYQNKEDPYFP